MPAPAITRSIGRLGAAACLTSLQPLHASFGRTCRTTWKLPGS
jgi:hypothetical protein